MSENEAQALFARYVERHVASGERLDLDALCAESSDLLPTVRGLVARYEQLDAALGTHSHEAAPPHPAATSSPLPTIAGFRTLERLGRGGSGEVLKLEDLTLGRVVAAKVLRGDSPLAATLGDFLREARALALFEDPRIVHLFEYRAGDPPVLLMEHVDGFALDEISPALEHPQRARIMAEVAAAIGRAHALGIQHRDLKPGHILGDARRQPKILDFGLSRSEPDRGHGVGTLAYMAPEQLDPGRPIDARTDVYALGVILYELLCGRRPCSDDSDDELMRAIRAGEPPLPTEIAPGVPEPLQAIALKAMSRDPAERYATASEMAEDLRRWLDGRPVLARPVAYRTALARRLVAQVDQIGEWARQKLIYPHEAERLRAAYRPLEAREDDWIVGSRVLSYAQIALYLGAFLLACGSLLYLTTYLNDAVKGLVRPALTLLVPFAAMNAAARALYRRERKAVAIAFFLGAAALLPLALAILFREAGWLMSGSGGANELFPRVTNLQLQVSLGAGCAWVAFLAVRTRTVALSSGAAALLLAFHLALLGDFGLRHWIKDGHLDTLAFGLAPLVAVVGVAGFACERKGWSWFAQPLYFGGSALFVAALELLAWDGRALAHLGITLTPLSPKEVSDPHLLDTVAAMTTNGIFVYVVGVLLERHGTALLKTPARLMCAIAPFATLEPLAYLSDTDEYSRRFDWLYLTLALSVAFLAQMRQRHAFYYAGLLNTGVAILLITQHYKWHDRPAWAMAVLAVGALALAAGSLLDWSDRRRRMRR